MRKTIVFVAPQLKTGGGNRVFIELANILVLENFVYIVYPNNSEMRNSFYLNKKVNVIAVGSLATTKFSKFWNVLKTFLFINKNFKNSYVIVSDSIISILGILLRAHNKFRFVQADDYNIFNDGEVLGDGFLLRMYKILTKISYSYKFTYIFNSKFSFNRFKAINPKYSCSAEIVHPGLNHAVFRPKEDMFSNKGLQISLVARRHPSKGMATFIDAWNGLSQHIREEVSSVVLISHEDMSKYYHENFYLISPKSDEEIANIYRSSDIFISTSWSEGFGLPPLEAMACGCAVITSKSGGVDEFAQDGLNCLMYMPKDTEGLKKCITDLITNAPLRQILSQKAIETSTKFEWNISADQLTSILESNSTQRVN